MRWHCDGFAVLSALALLSCAEASRAPGVMAEIRSPIIGGTAVPGAWPNVVSLEGQCTAVLLSPEVLVYAGHCGTDFGSIWLGDDLDIQIGIDAMGKPIVERKSDGPSAAIDHCSAHPLAGIGTGWDAAFCVLSEPLAGIEGVTAIEGCETDAVDVGTESTLVGYGFVNATDTSTLGVKHAVTTPILDIGNETLIGTAEAGTCRGDSGGPAFVQVDEGGGLDWRLFGLLSSGAVGQCGLGYYTEMSGLIGWLESESGRDLSPCFSESGKWAPTRACRKSVLDADGVPAKASSDTARYATTCGKPFDGDPSKVHRSPRPDDQADPRASSCSLASPRAPGPPGHALYPAALMLAGLGRRLRSRRRITASCRSPRRTGRNNP